MTYYRELTVEEVKEFVKDYPKYRNEKLSEMYKVSVAQVENTAATFGLKKHVVLRYDYHLSADQLLEFKALYPTTTNSNLSDIFGISPSSIAQLGYKHRLKKVVKKVRNTKVKRKRCSRCQLRMVLSRFQKCKATSDGYGIYCDQCRKLNDDELMKARSKRIAPNAPQWWIAANNELRSKTQKIYG